MTIRTRIRAAVLFAAVIALLSACSDIYDRHFNESPPEEDPKGPDERREEPDLPGVTILQPTDGSLVAYGEEVTVLVSVAGALDATVSVTVNLDGVPVDSTAGPGDGFEHEVVLPADTPGTRVVSAVVTDDTGATATATTSFTTGEWLDEAFSIVVLPDTQNMIGVMTGNNEMVAQMTEWIVDNVEERAIAFVTHVGDVTDRGFDELEWQRADEQLGGLDGAVPYGIAIGDHDYEIEENVGSSTALYTTYFGPDRYAAYDWYGGSGPDGLSHYQYFTAGGQTFLHVTLEWEARGPADDPSSPLGWARALIEDHPSLPTIITTHAYLWDKPGQEGRTSSWRQRQGYILDDEGRTSYPGSLGEEIFQALVEPNDNVFMVLNGHYHSGQGSSDGEYHQVSLNGSGLEVYEMLSNYQDYKNGGDGWLRIVDFQPGGGDDGRDRIAVSTYSPVRDLYQLDAASAFHFDLDFAARFGRLDEAGAALHDP